MREGAQLKLAKAAKGMLLPRRFFVTSGCGVSASSPLNAFDAALTNAGIGQCNLVCVSSILPANAKMVNSNPKIEPGTITFCVLARADGGPGDLIGAGLGWAWIECEGGERYGVVAEAHGRKGREEIEEELEVKLREMADARGARIIEMEKRCECMQVPDGCYGCCVVALVYVP